MSSERKSPYTDKAQLRSRFITVTVQQDEDGRARIVLEGNYMEISGFMPGDAVDAIVQPDLISVLRVE